MQGGGPLLTLVLLGAVFYFFLIAPQRRRQRQQQQMTSQLEPGAEVMTTAGLFATVRSVTDTEVELEVAPGVVSRYAKGAIARVIPPPGPDEPEPHEIEADDLDGDHTGEGTGGTDTDPGRVQDGGDDGPAARP